MEASLERVSFNDELLLENYSAVSIKSDEARLFSKEASISLNYN
jgi:hypothetical protein